MAKGKMRSVGRRIWWQGQNLKEDHPAGTDVFNRRGWIHVGGHAHRTIQGWLRISRRWDGFRFVFSRGGMEEDYTVSVGFGWIFFGVILSGFRAYEALPRSWGRETGISLHGDMLTVMLDCDDSECSRIDGKMKPLHGWYRSWFLKDQLLGRAHYTRGEGDWERVVIRMPEGGYSGAARISVDTWKRPRWPWPLRVSRVRVEVKGGVPMPGKGENSWDCGDDASYSWTGPADSIAEGITQFEQFVLERRRKYGHAGWQPGLSA